METLIEVIKKIESKKNDCIVFQKRYQTREMQDLLKYYEGAEWALTYSLGLLNEFQNK